MNAIIGMTAIASASDDSEKKEYCLTKITEASTHLLGVINDILDMSKIEANKFELFHADFSFENLLQKVVSIINFRVEERQQDFSIHLDPNIPAVIKSDEQRLSQVLTNLLSNAVKFTPEKGQIRLNTALLEEKDGDCIIRFDVTDTGIGITEEQQSRLFNSFEQADSSTSRKFGGTGLGLAISKRIVGMMDGHIWVESESGKGSTFAFTIKVKRRSEENMDSIRSNVTPDNLRIMVIDDAPEVLEYFSNVTQKLGCQCDAVSSGEAACEKINSNGAYDLYFVDWKMPGMDGIELSRKIKEHNPKLPVIVMISSTEWNVIEKDARAAGVDRFLQKPVFPSDIVNCINECVGVKEEVAKKGVVPEGIFEGKRVLLAEDVKINREIVIVRLEPTKVQMDCAVNGLEAVEKFIAASGKYDMIFMDMQMPEMDGLEATIAIRALNMREAGEVPIVAMTANVFQEDIEKCLAAGMNDHISKPLDFALVIDKMKKYI
jgi:CheY-like chemotaxis protein